MDFSMPGMNGAEAVNRIRLHASTRATPVIGITAHSETSTGAFRSVCDAVLEKPVHPDDLLAALRRALRWAVPPLPSA
jgi:CheY-like chemotaxis protein